MIVIPNVFVMCKNILSTLVVVFIFSSTYAQVVSDTIAYPLDSICMGPNRQYISPKTQGYFTNTIFDGIAMQTNAGNSLQNTLLAHVPNSSTNGTIRGSIPMYVIDGVAFSSEIQDYYNLNSFDYTSVSSIASANGLALYGGMASTGGLLVESKNGKNISRPQVEFNSFTSFRRLNEVSNSLYTLEKEDQWSLTSSLAYAQDYGDVDTRISYSNTYLPDGSTDPETRATTHNAKINTGFEISPRFTARLILDARHKKNTSEWSALNNDISGSQDLSSLAKSFFGNLTLNFQASDWLTISSQSGYSKLIEDISNNQTNVYELYQQYQNSTYGNDQKRAFINLMFTSSILKRDNLKIQYATGIQYDRYIVDIDAKSTLKTIYDNDLGNTTISSSGSNYDVKSKNRNWLNQLNLTLFGHWYVEANYRYDYFKDVEDDINDQPTYAVNTAFNFSEALHLQKKWLTSIMLRGNLGKTKAIEVSGFPFTSDILDQQNYIPNPELKPTHKRSSEIGADFSFIHSRLFLQTTYFHDYYNQSIYAMPMPWGSGYVYVATDVGERKNKGWEFILGGTPVSNATSTLLTKVIIANYKTRITPNNEGINITNPDPAAPQWSGSLLTQYTIKSMFAQLLVTHQYGGEGNYYDFLNNTFNTYNYTQTWMRDISFGYNFNWGTLSLSGRNLIKLYSKEDASENNYLSRVPKTVSLSASLRILN